MLLRQATVYLHAQPMHAIMHAIAPRTRMCLQALRDDLSNMFHTGQITASRYDRNVIFEVRGCLPGSACLLSPAALQPPLMTKQERSAAHMPRPCCPCCLYAS